MTDIIVYLKNPAPGEVKTRLQTRYTPEQATRLYRAFIQDTIETAQSVEADRYFVAYTPTGCEVEIADLVPEGWNLTPQIGADLGNRMLGSLRSCITSGANKVVLIGTDIPSLPRSHLLSAINRLDKNDLVLGPAADGGFYLIGTRITLPEIFSGVTWSTNKVFEQATTGIRSHGLLMSLIPPWHDIDTPEDLDAALLQASAETMLHTRSAVDALTN
ncbi:MAG: TIGR04282 family arsenosugar biosynthesis glycosyltransferase [Candidatus Latescibacterota bacterium]|nr:TIGR04282 family arsenosugar biosynthesis glycosyltransferase [Candidatus Latescibacterota bacterium]